MMTKNFLKIGGAAILTVLSAAAQQHRWAGQTLDDREWEIHERLAVLPSHGVFDDIRFQLQGDTVVLSGQVIKEIVKQNAERAVRNIAGVSTVVNRIDVLPSSRKDDAIRMNVYRAIYEHAPLEKYGTRGSPAIHIIVKNGWVTLEGVVDSDDDRHAAHLRALHVTPHVTDNLRVVPDES
ncbi:MAG TPA: BON domain-containing protein [Bryobacteraceae bacterium]|jgi:hyperosmotically inducible periplasmic protein|nr:BON domain-containing protein [Bryobacteraceae bacterium]